MGAGGVSRVMTEQRPEPDLTCRELVELVTDYIENDLSPENYARVVEHLAGCDGCDRYVEQMLETIGVLGMLQEKDVSPQDQEKLRAVFREWKREREME